MLIWWGAILTEALQLCGSFSCDPPFGCIEHLLEVFICVHNRTPPGGGVHGMCGYFAARMALACEWKLDKMD